MLRLLLLPAVALALLTVGCNDDDKKPSVARTVVAVPVTPSPCPTPPAAPSGVAAPTFTITPNQVKAGGEVTVAGSGFTPHGIITAIGVAPNGLCLPLGSGPADDKGAFTATTTVQPIAPPGNYQVRLTDGSGRSASQPVTLLP